MKRVCVDIQQAALWITTIPLANTRALSYTVTKNHIWTYPTVMHLLFLFGSVAFEGFISHPHSRGVRQIFATSVHINLTSCPPLFFQLPPTAALSVFSTYRTSHGARLFVTGAVQERCCVLICSGDDSSLDEIKWAVGCLCLFLTLWVESFPR